MVSTKKFKHAFYSLSGRLITGVTVIQLILIPVLLGSIIYFMNTTLKDRFINDKRRMTGSIVASFEKTNPVSNRTETIDMMDEIIMGGNVVYAEIILPRGEKITSQIENKNKNFTFIEDLYFKQNDDQVYFIEAPIYMSGLDEISLLRLGYDEKPVEDQLERISLYTSSIIAIYIIINLVLVFFLGQRATMPLKRLRQASRQIQQGFVDTALDVQSPVSDVRDLAIDLDLMRKELVSQASALKHQALHDALTHLPNRVLLEDRLNQAVLKGARSSIPFALLLMDLDRFKEVNDTLGHQVGDEVLRMVSSRLSSIIRKGDTVSRLGGDEFAIILYGTESKANEISEKLANEIKRPFHIRDNTLHIGVSIGISHYPQLGHSAEELMRQADIAMYDAKRSGVSYKTYSKTRDRNTREKMTLDNDFRKAIEAGEVTLCYQPKIDLRSAEFNEVEALARWTHPDHDFISPEKFIRIAENKGFIYELTNNLIEIAINDAANWYHSGRPLEVSVNLSPKNLLDEQLPDRISSLLSKAGLPAKYFSLEITENAIIQDPSHARIILLALKEMGVRSIIDDFGTGYSSLVYLRHLPVSEIKIDKSFVVNMIHNDDDIVIINATTRMAHDLGLLVTAEGVESSMINDRLIKLGCDKGQGFHYSKALSFDDLNTWRVHYNRSLISGVK